MPLTCKKVGNKYRLAHGDGSLSSVKAEHDSESSCMAQARAINANIEAGFELGINVALFCPGKKSFLALSNDNPADEGLVYEKELIYTGEFEKDDKVSAPHHFSVTPEVIRHWHDTGKLMLHNGVEIPMPLEHTSDPEKKRAKLVDFRMGKNLRGEDALFGVARFNTREAAEQLKHSDVSIFVIDEYTDGKKNTYLKPIRHAAFTDYPVIPGLQEFKPIAASFVSADSTKRKTGMSLALATKLGLSLAAGATDESADAQIVEAFTKLRPKESIPTALAASFGNMLKNSRGVKLSALIANGNITKACADALAEEWCADKSLSLALSNVGPSGDDPTFDNLVKSLEKNKAIIFDEKTGAQIQNGVGALPNLALSMNQNNGKTSNPLIADADRRAKEAAAQN